MPRKLHRHFTWIGVGLYLVALAVVSLWFRPYHLQPLWMAWGIGTVLFFFGLSYLFFQRWRLDPAKTFTRKLFWTALGIRVVYVVAVLFYYYYQTGISLEYQAADSLSYHFTASRLSDLAREGRFHELFQSLRSNTMGFSDQGYLLYLSTLYTLFGKNIVGPRILKAVMSAVTSLCIYKLAARSLGEKTGRLAGVMAVFLPQLIHYTGTYMKETEMVFLATAALERMDYLIRSKRYTFWNIALPVLLTALTFGFRTILGMTLCFSFVVFVLLADLSLLPRKTKAIFAAAVTLVTVMFLLTPIGEEMRIIFRINFNEIGYLAWKYQNLGMRYAQYANWKYMAPGAFTLPLTNLVEVANENQKLMNGTYFVKNYLAFFALWSLVISLRDKKWRTLGLVGTYTWVYALLIAFSFAANSERYHLPVLPGIIILAAFAMTRFRRKDFVAYYGYSTVLLAAIVLWNALKLAARGLFFS